MSECVKCASQGDIRVGELKCKDCGCVYCPRCENQGTTTHECPQCGSENVKQNTWYG